MGANKLEAAKLYKNSFSYQYLMDFGLFIFENPAKFSQAGNDCKFDEILHGPGIDFTKTENSGRNQCRTFVCKLLRKMMQDGNS